LGLDVEREDAELRPELDLLVGLADAGEDDPVRRDSRLHRSAQLVAGDDVDARAERGERLDDREVPVGLHRVADEVRRTLRTERGVEAAEALLDQRAAVDVDGRADLARDPRERQPVAAELSLLAVEAGHGFLLFLRRRAVETS